MTMNTKGIKKRPIGVFDSGIGGLTVLAEIARAMPDEDTIYLGDTARVPYGSKSKETIIRYATEVAELLISKDVKLIVVACNTASAYALAELRAALSVPVIGVIEPGARAAAAATRAGRVGVIGTEGTIKSSAYCAAIKSLNPDIITYTQACPLFVPLVEEGWADDDVTAIVASRYLNGFKAHEIDTLVLGCTHYPLLKNIIASVMGPSVRLIDSAEATAEEVRRVIAGYGLTNPGGSCATHTFFVTDSPERFVSVGKRFFGPGLESAKLASVGR